MKILVDDIRDVEQVGNVLSQAGAKLPEGFEFDVVLRSYDEALNFFSSFKGEFDLFLDHDLGAEQDRDNGYTLFNRISEMGLSPRILYIVTSNPVGHKAITAAADNAGMRRLTSRVFSF